MPVRADATEYTGEGPLGPRLKEVAAVFLRLGFTAFGGPAAHIALMEDELVRRRKWIDRQHFLDMVAAVNFIPGPNSTEVAIHLGMVRAGYAGLIVGGVCFIAPAMLIILPIGWMYLKWGALPQANHVLGAVNAAVVGIVAAALWRFGEMALRDAFTVMIALLATGASFAAKWFPQYQPDLIILSVAGIFGAIYYARGNGRGAAGSGGQLVGAVVLPLAAMGHGQIELLRVFGAFLKIGGTLFGSGYLLVSYLQRDFVDHHGWLTRQQLLDAFAVGQITPGPLLTTATFIGYVLGERFIGGMKGAIVGAVGCTIAIFLPSFFFVAIVGRFLPAIRANRYARGALDAVNAAIVAMILVVLLRLGQISLVPQWRPDYVNIVVAAASLWLLVGRDVNSTRIVLGAGLAGVVRTVVS